MQESDEILLERARAGDSAAVEALLTRHQAQVYRFGVRLCRDPEAAKDVLLVAGAADALVGAASGAQALDAAG
jgi:DNA-directed RNA polymerase specialized sigma24 family protein